MKFILVYQAGIANLFKVPSFDSYTESANKRVFQGAFNTAEAMARGAMLAGANMKTYTQAEIRNGTGFPRDARFSLIERSPDTGTLARMWINQPSTSQPHHELHGTRVLASREYNDTFKVYFLSGATVSQQLLASALSIGWPE